LFPALNLFLKIPSGVKAMQCQSCGANLRKASHFCPVCGEESLAATGLLADNTKQTNILASGELATMLAPVPNMGVNANVVANTAVAANARAVSINSNKIDINASNNSNTSNNTNNSNDAGNNVVASEAVSKHSGSPKVNEASNSVINNSLAKINSAANPNIINNLADYGSPTYDSVPPNSSPQVSPATNSIAPIAVRSATTRVEEVAASDAAPIALGAITARPMALAANLPTTDGLSNNLPATVAELRDSYSSTNNRSSNSKTLNCRTCQQELKPQAKFCSNCGASVKPPLFWQLQQFFWAKLQQLQPQQQFAPLMKMPIIANLLLLAAALLVLLAIVQFWLPSSTDSANGLVIYHLRSIELLLVAVILVGVSIVLRLDRG
jgi:RNA polymerase subunit RPABC4/transcription elongation factor Spt4